MQLFDQIGSSVRKLDVVVRPDATGYLGTTSFPGCTITFGVRKAVLRDGAWRVGRVATLAEIPDWDTRESQLGNPMRSSTPDALRFAFVADHDECGWGTDFATLRAHSLTADLPTHGGLRALRQPGSLTTNDWTLETATLPLRLSVSFWTPGIGGVLRPTPVSRLFAAVGLPSSP